MKVYNSILSIVKSNRHDWKPIHYNPFVCLTRCQSYSLWFPFGDVVVINSSVFSYYSVSIKLLYASISIKVKFQSKCKINELKKRTSLESEKRQENSVEYLMLNLFQSEPRQIFIVWYFQQQINFYNLKQFYSLFWIN